MSAHRCMHSFPLKALNKMTRKVTPVKIWQKTAYHSKNKASFLRKWHRHRSALFSLFLSLAQPGYAQLATAQEPFHGLTIWGSINSKTMPSATVRFLNCILRKIFVTFFGIFSFFGPCTGGGAGVRFFRRLPIPDEVIPYIFAVSFTALPIAEDSLLILVELFLTSRSRVSLGEPALPSRWLNVFIVISSRWLCAHPARPAPSPSPLPLPPASMQDAQAWDYIATSKCLQAWVEIRFFRLQNWKRA